MKLSIDNREKKERVDNCFKYFNMRIHNGISVELSNLKYGDYLFSRDDDTKQVVFEFKTMADFMNSVKDGSVFEEVVNQTYAYDYSYIVIAGFVEDYCKEMWKLPIIREHWGKYFDYVSANLTMFRGAYNKLLTICPVIHSYDEEDSFSTMLDVSDKILNGQAHYVFGSKRRLKSNKRLVGLLSNELGKKTSELIVDELELKSLQDLLSVDREELLNIKGVGEKTANNIMNFIYGD